MARDTFIEVLLELPKADADNHAGVDRIVVEKLKRAADEQAAAVGGVVRADTPPELHMSQGRHLITNEDTYLIASRWRVTVPDSAATV